ncbi:gamma-glutamyltranspeptidase [Klebsiella pneumoniae subsp. rhinoscleromatis]|nr:gamma-glutamyltranspeptidase [Klebsiella pneumoniae subsp. rhinoscleromatis]
MYSSCSPRKPCSRLADSIDDASASPWGGGKGPGDTVWMGVVDNSGLAVSFIQSIYHEFGSGVVLPDTGIVWQNRGAAFSLRSAASPGAGPLANSHSIPSTLPPPA